MDFEIPYEHSQIQLLVRKFIDEELRPLEPVLLENHDIPKDIWKELVKKSKAVGLFDAFVPSECGGGGIRSWLAHILVYEEIGKYYKNFRRLFDNGFEIGADIATKEQLDEYFLPLWRGEKRISYLITEPDAGSDNLAMKTFAVKKNGSWVINGMKHFISLADVADFFVVFAKTDLEKRRISLFLADRNTPGLTVGRRQKTMAPFEDIYEVYLDNVVVPEDHLLGELGNGMKSAFNNMNLYRLRVGAMGVGAADYALKSCTDWAKQRVTFGQTLATRQSIQEKIVDSWSEIQSTRWMVYYTASKGDQGASNKEIIPLAAACKVMGSDLANRVLDRAIQIYGGAGYASDLPLERMYRDYRCMSIYEGSNEVMKHLVIARSLLEV